MNSKLTYALWKGALTSGDRDVLTGGDGDVLTRENGDVLTNYHVSTNVCATVDTTQQK